MARNKAAVNGIRFQAASRSAVVKTKSKKTKKGASRTAPASSNVENGFVDETGALKGCKRKRSRSIDVVTVEKQHLNEENTAATSNDLCRAHSTTGEQLLQTQAHSRTPTTQPRKKKRKKMRASSFSQPVEPHGSSSNEEGAADEHADSSCLLGAREFRKLHKIVVPESCPTPFETFDAAEKVIGKSLTNALREQGFKAPTPIQAQAWPILLKGDDMIGVARTGSGKTYAFLLPVFSRLADRDLGAESDGPACPKILVLAPTRELAQQISMEAKKLAPVVRALVVCMYGGAEKRNQVRELKSGVHVLVATPGRLLDFANGDTARDLDPVVSLGAVSYLVLDEADRMLDMGFGREMGEIIRLCPKSGRREEGFCASGSKAGARRQTVLFTATWPDTVQRAAKLFLSSAAVQVRVEQNSVGNRVTATSDVTQKVFVIKERDKLSYLKKIIENDLRHGQTAIVFASRKNTCDSLEEELRGAAVCAWCRAIHGDKEQQEREQNLNVFRSMTVKPQPHRKAVLVATDVASRGLDIPGIALVVIYDFGGETDRPGVESYVHRIGRAGRAGRRGTAITLFTPEDSGPSAFADLLRNANQVVPAELQALADRDAAWWEGSHRRAKKGKGFSGSKKIKQRR